MSADKRLLLHEFFPRNVCKELEFIHKSCGVAGYRPYVLSTTLFHLVATNCSSLIMPFIPIRETVKELIEEQYECDYELFVEFTGLISWTKGAKINWHNDNSRPYLKQRHFTAVCYLNSHGYDFHGGVFHFKNGDPTTVVPSIGDVLIYRADEVHCVDEITDGERCTLALWFTLDSSHDEDIRILESIQVPSPIMGLHENNTHGVSSFCDKRKVCDNSKAENTCVLQEDRRDGNDDISNSYLLTEEKWWIPLCASSSMYLNSNLTRDQDMAHFSSEYECQQASSEQTLDFDIREARLKAMGFCFCSCTSGDDLSISLEESKGVSRENIARIQDALEGPLKLKFKGHDISHVFANSIHALQVVFFSEWKESEDSISLTCSVGGERLLEDTKGYHFCGIQSLLEAELAQSIAINQIQNSSNSSNTITEMSTCLSNSIANIGEILSSFVLIHEWEQYMLEKWNLLVRCYPVWRSLRCLSASVS